MNSFPYIKPVQVLHVQLPDHGLQFGPYFSRTNKLLTPQATTLNAEFLFTDVITINLA